jgi:hypothetical protein
MQQVKKPLPGVPESTPIRSALEVIPQSHGGLLESSPILSFHVIHPLQLAQKMRGRPSLPLTVEEVLDLEGWVSPHCLQQGIWR